MMSVGYHDLAASCSTRQRVLRLCHVLPTSSRRRTDPRIDCAKYGTRRCAFRLWLRMWRTIVLTSVGPAARGA